MTLHINSWQKQILGAPRRCMDKVPRDSVRGLGCSSSFTLHSQLLTCCYSSQHTPYVCNNRNGVHQTPIMNLVGSYNLLTGLLVLCLSHR